MVWSGVASAAGPDARHRDEGDASAHRGGTVTQQTASRRRNRLRWLAFCRRGLENNYFSHHSHSPASPTAKGQTRRPRPFLSNLLGFLELQR
jgi:hypothetical protein